MKYKSAIVALSVAAVASVCEASVSFRWLSPASSTALNELGGSLASGSTVLLFTSTDVTVDLNTGIQLQSTYGNDNFIGAAATGVGGRYTTSYQTLGVAGAGSGSYVGLYTYMVLVNTAYFAGITPGAIAPNAYYAVSSMSPGTLTQYDTDPLGTQQSFTDSSTANNQIGDAAAVMRTTVQNVPEPSTVALLGLGLGLVALRRKFARK